MGDPELGTAIFVDDHGRGLARASALLLSTSAASLAVGLFRSKLVAILAGPAGIAATANLNLFLSAAALLASGVAGAGAIRALAAARSSDDARTSQWLERYVFAGPAIVGVGFALLALAAARPLASLLLGDEDLAPLVWIVSLAIPIAVLANSYTTLLEALLKVGSIARAEVLTGLVSIPLVALCLVAWGLPGAAVAVATAFGVRLFFLHLGGRNAFPRGRWLLAFRAPRSAVAGVVRLGAAVAVVSVATIVGPLLVRTEIVRHLGLDVAGLYQPAAQLSDTYLDVLLASTSVYLFPRLTQLVTRGEIDAARRELIGGLRISLAALVPLILLAIGFSSWIVGLLYSSEFEGAADPLVTQMAGSLPKVMAWSLGMALVPLGHARAWASIAMLTIAVRVLGVFLTVPTLGLQGAALAYDIAWLVGLFLTLMALRRDGRISLRWADGAYGGAAAALIVLLIVLRTWSPSAAAIASIGAVTAWAVIARGPLRQLVTAVRTR